MQPVTGKQSSPLNAMAAHPQTQVVNSRDLLAGRRIVVIQHGSEEYRLQLTRGGKLILTK